VKDAVIKLFLWQQCGASMTDTWQWDRYYITTWREASGLMLCSVDGAIRWTPQISRLALVCWMWFCLLYLLSSAALTYSSL